MVSGATEDNETGSHESADESDTRAGSDQKPEKQKQAGRASETGKGSTDEQASELIFVKRTVTVDLQYNVAAAMCNIPLPPINIAIATLLLYTEPKDNAYVRFHAIQSLILTGITLTVLVLVGTVRAVVSIIPMLGAFLNLIIVLVMYLIYLSFAVTLVLQMIAAYKGQKRKVPVVTKYVEDYMSRN